MGHHLAAELSQSSCQVLGSGLDDQLDPKLSPLVAEYYGNTDLTSPEAVAKLPLDEVDAIINLAGLAQQGSSFGKEDLYNRINVGVHTTVLDRLKQLDRKDVRVVAISTGAVYDSDQQMPISEAGALVKDGSPYALSKIAMEEALQPYIDDGFDVVIARPFNHIGPGQLGGFLLPDLTEQALHNDKVTVGNLKSERDYTDVRDVVKAYVLLATQPTLASSMYNVCSGRSVAGETILQEVLKACNRQDLPVEIDSARIRPNDPPKIVGDNSRLKQDTGWQPTIPLEQTIQDFVKNQL